MKIDELKVGDILQLSDRLTDTSETGPVKLRVLEIGMFESSAKPGKFYLGAKCAQLGSDTECILDPITAEFVTVISHSDPAERAKVVVAVWGSDPRPTRDEVLAKVDAPERWREITYIEVSSTRQLKQMLSNMPTPWQTLVTSSAPRSCLKKLGATTI